MTAAIDTPLHKRKPRVNEVRWVVWWPLVVPFSEGDHPLNWDSDGAEEHAASREEAIEIASRAVDESALGWALFWRVRWAPYGYGLARWVRGRATICEGVNPNYDIVDPRLSEFDEE